MTEDLLPGLVPAGRITTLIAPPGDELAALTAALAVSWRLGIELVPGWVPEVLASVMTTQAPTTPRSIGFPAGPWSS
jgi:hypothetical protein